MNLNTCEVPTTDPLERQRVFALLSDEGSFEDLQTPYSTEEDEYREGAYDDDERGIALEM